MPKNTMNEKEAAEFIGLSKSTLRKARMEGSRVRRCPVPLHIKVGRRVLYRLQDLEKFLKEHLVEQNIPSNKGGLLNEKSEK